LALTSSQPTTPEQDAIIAERYGEVAGGGFGIVWLVAILLRLRKTRTA
jgi:hypothetical protein